MVAANTGSDTMYMGKIHAAEDRHRDAAEARGSALLGIGFMLIAIPYWGARLLGETLWRDMRRAGRAAKLAGQSCSEAFRRR